MSLKRTFVLALSAVMFTAAPAFSDEVVVPQASEEGQASGEEVITYTIVPRDTLWHISGRFLKNPFKWPKIWKLNPYIKNPHLIYPGNIVRITPNDIEEIA